MMQYSGHNVYGHNDFLKHINIESIDTILKLGAFDGSYTSEINDIYNPKKIYSIEANPDKVEIIKNNQNNLDNVDFSSILLLDVSREVDFYFISESGILSSIYKHPAESNTNKIKLNSITLDDFCKLKNITSIDLICADVEGSEAQIFKNQKILNTVKYIISEVKIDKLFKGELFPGIYELQQSLEPYGFLMVEYICRPGFPFGDSLWIKNNN
jgi:FkbM family methyltransferase